MSYRGLSVTQPAPRRGWIWLLSLGLALLMYEPLASAVDSPERVRPRNVPAVHVTAPALPPVHMTAFFPNPLPRRVQAVGTPQQARDSHKTDRSAHLRHATPLALDADGYRVLGPRMRRYFGTYELVELIQQTGAVFAERHKRSDDYFLVGDLSRERGGTIRDGSGRRVHSSHRNGLDVDINYLRLECGEGRDEIDPDSVYSGRLNNPNCRFHMRRNMDLMRDFVRGGPRGEPTLVSRFFVSPAFVTHACQAARKHPGFRRRYRKVLERMEPMPGHQAHFHVRLKCPDNSRGCRDVKRQPKSPCRRR